ncbi:ubiquitin carboxyl-terminal hydrolase 47 isoform X2 [Lethenteron reissneri]|uniref:ubiquitin carboxyl-terminal hydrolase 47 isoform X2 n=1 Tax=Lethenteron reissneri TaxID=7753 RepID=UPI002AB6DD6E|nr:ubiquitin carboxyl-terminal hydrolase 47 isoform X2 [Lethenteron reissneri]
MSLGEENQLVPKQAASWGCKQILLEELKRKLSHKAEKANAAEEARVLCIVTDTTRGDTQRITVNLPFSTPLRELQAHVAAEASYQAHTFLLVWKQDEHAKEPLNGESEESLKDAGFAEGKKNYLHLTDKNGIQPLPAPQPPPDDSGGTKGPGGGGGGVDENGHEKVTGSPPSESVATCANDPAGPAYGVLCKSETGYVGLVNQAMTCYLNSLLQTLYMTPEFRNALYKWEFDGSEEEGDKSIPFQLQRLFVQLQTSRKRAVETTDLTRSFGWDSSEAWQQHDVQELCRVMFDALEQKWKNTEQANLINVLYQGQLKDYVRCLECGHESSRLDTYLDIPLAIRPFGSNQAYSSVEEALQAFVQPETLDGTNQYFCERCSKKCDAHKGLEFLYFPYLLSLQLKRFDFDYSTLHRIKLNDRMTFPDHLDLNAFIEAPDEEKCGQADSCADSGAENEGSCHSDQLLTDFSYADAVDEGIDLENSSLGERNCKPILAKQGPWVYELFSIMVHSGSAAGGHYYAYIKSFSDGQWYSFNDQHVNRITQDDIRKTYGGATGNRSYYSSTFSSSTNAYMLIYRQIQPSKNAKFMEVTNFPQHIHHLMNGEKEREENEKRQREIERNTCKIKLFCLHPVKNTMVESKLEVHKERTLEDATYLAHKLLDLEDVLPVERCRLVKYDEFHDSLERSYEGEEGTQMGTLLGGVKSSYVFDLLLETRREDQDFQPYKPGGVTVKVHVVDLVTEAVSPGVSIRAYLSQSVSEFKALIAQATGLDVEGMRVVLERYYNDLRLLSVPNKSLKSEGFFRSNKVFVESSGSPDSQLSFPQSLLWRLLDRHGNTIRLLVALPDGPAAATATRAGPAAAAAAAESQAEHAARGRDSERSERGSRNRAVEAILEESTERLRSLSLEQERRAARRRENGDADAAAGSPPPPPHRGDGLRPGAADGAAAPGDGEIRGRVGPPDSDSETNNEQSAGSLCDSDATTGSPSQDVDSSASAGSRENEDGRATPPETEPELERDPDSRCHSDERSDSELNNERSTSSVDSDLLSSSHSSDTLCNVAAAAAAAAAASAAVVGAAGTPSAGAPGTHDDDAAASSSSSSSALPVAGMVLPNGLDAYTGITSSRRSKSLAGVDTAKAKKEGRERRERGSGSESEGEDEGKEREGGAGAAQAYTFFRVEEGPAEEGTAGDRFKCLTVHVDKRMTLAAFKRHLEPVVGVSSSQFKVFRVYANNQEFESVRLNETLSSFSDDNRVTIRLGRALRKGEYRVKVYQLLLKEPEPCKFLLDTVFAKGMSVRQSKEELLPQLQQQCALHLNIDRFRLRKKTWKNPGTIFLDTQTYEDDIPIFSNWEVFLELLEAPERMVCMSQLAVLARRWKPSTLVLEPFEEVVLESNSVDELKEKLGKLGQISPEDVEFAKGRGTFPCDISVLEIHQDLDWNPKVTTLNVWPLYICDDGAVVFYRNRDEAIQELSDEQRSELQKKESMRLQRTGGQQVPYSPRKEKALKIYVDGGVTRE